MFALDWHDARHFDRTGDRPCRWCGRPTPLRDAQRRPSHKVCAEQQHNPASDPPAPAATAADGLLAQPPAQEESLTDWDRAYSAAHFAAERGLHVFPLARSKKPAIPSPHPPGPGRDQCRAACGQFGHGVHDATTDHNRIDAMFGAAGWATGYGIACGRAPHHLIGLDLDRKNGLDGVADLDRLAAEHGFTVPTTATVATPTGGLHLWVAAPSDAVFPNSAHMVAPGIDVRGPAGYLVGPGSLGTAGRYGFAPGTDPTTIAPCPPELLALLTPPPAPATPIVDTTALRERIHKQDAYVQAALDREADTVRAQQYPGRAKRLFASAAALGRHLPTGVLDEALAFDTLLDAGMATGLSRTECEHTIRRGLARGAGTLRPAA
ncbi:bifunctional DNA primase/polymerase [Kitasatospora sp. NPDC059408]|uniref:bifunctional DNA primase/polymerase n=1 Tax=Kitasatospora sp. NPDC059408 TaxID=3346823 RepID=UPI00367AF99D